MTHYDFIVVGTGAGGGTLVNSLAKTGASVLVLERGGFLPREQQNWDASEVFVKGRYVSKDTWYDGQGKPFQPQSHYYVGGATKLYGAALYRLRPEDFGAVRHVDGWSPAWPVGYGDLEPWYSAAEQLYQVHGQHGTDPTEGPWSRQYPHPPVSHSPRIARLAANLEAGGYRPFPAPAAVLLNEDRPELSACIRCNTCDGHPCLVRAKADAEVIGIRPVMELPNVTLLTDTEVLQLKTGNGRVTGVTFRRNGAYAAAVADTVILAAGAANTAKILLASGIANSSGQVGRNYMCHNSRAVMAIDSEPNTTVFQKTLGLNDFYLASEDEGRPFPLGNIQMVGKSCAAAMRGESKLAALAPEMSLAEIARHSVDFWLTTEDLPLPENRVTLAPDGNIRLAYAPSNDREAAWLYRELRAVLRTAGMPRHHEVFTSKTVGLAAVAHQAGTARMGNNPATSVVDENCKAHDLGNLYVADASVFTSIGAVNPALTVMALALRLADHLS
jgi:choline dehydrogenase-like flavoprotein